MDGMPETAPLETTGSSKRAFPRSPEFWLVAYLLSRCTRTDGRPPAALGVDKWVDAYELFFDTLGADRELGQFRNSLKNARDAFDGHHPNVRQGWKADTKGKPADLPTVALSILEQWRGRSDADLEAEVLQLISESELLDKLVPSAHPLPDVKSISMTPAMVLKPSSSSAETAPSQRRLSIRRTANAKRIGDRAEQLVEQLLRSQLEPLDQDTLRHHAMLGEKPGYDLSYTQSGNSYAVEVKGTTQDEMCNFELTAREVEAAKSFGQRYRVYLVSGVDSKNPRYQILQGIGSSFRLTPLTFRVELIKPTNECEPSGPNDAQVEPG